MRARLNLEDALALLISSGLLILGYVRLKYGVSVVDEAFDVLMTYLPAAGGRWFVSENSLNQIAGILASPFVIPRGWLFGTDGIMLYVRHLHLALAVLVSVQVYRTIRHYQTRAVAILLASLAFVYVPYNQATLSYNNLGSLLFGLGTFLSVRALIERRRGLAIASALGWCGAVFAYPSLIFTFLFFLLIAFGFYRRQHRLAIAYAVTTTGAGLAALLVLALCGFENVWASYQWSRVGAGAGNLGKLFYAASLIPKFLPPVVLTIPVLAIYFFADRTRLQTWAFALVIATYFAFGTPYEGTLPQVLWPLLQVLTFSFIARRWARLDEKQWLLIGLIIAPAIFGGVLTCLSSRMTLYATVLTGIFGALAVLTLALDSRQRVAAWMTALLLLGYSEAARFEDFNEDGPWASLTTEVRDGPFAGLITFPDKAAWLDKVQTVIRKFHGERMIIKDAFSGGFLVSGNIPVGPQVYFAPAIYYPEARARYMDVYRDPTTWPDVVIDLAYYPCQPGKFWPFNVPGLTAAQDPFVNFFQNLGVYDVVEKTAEYQVLRRKR